MAKKVTELTALTTADAADVVPIVDVSAGVTKKTTVAGLATAVAANIPAGSLTNSMLSTTAGEAGGVSDDWTPTLGNLSGGTLNYAKYTKIGRIVRCEFKYTLGGAGMGTAPTISLPEAPATHYADGDIIPHVVLFSDTGAQDYYGLARISQTDDLITLYVRRASSTYLDTANITNSIPHTWASTDVVRVSWEYEAAA